MTASTSQGGNRGVAIVTGACRGIGAAVAVALAREGFSVALVDIMHEADAEHTKADIEKAGAKSVFIQSDIANLDGHAAIVDAAAALGPVTCLINNAGVNMPVRDDMLKVPPDVYDQVLDVNLRGSFFLTQTVAQHMLSKPRTPAHYSISFITSANATMVSPEKSAYCLSKAALSMASKLFAARLGEENVEVYEVQPGFIRTEMSRAVWETYGDAIKAGKSVTRRWGEPEDVGRVVAALSTGALGFCTGSTIPVGGGLHVHRL